MLMNNRAMTICEVLLIHTSRVFSELSQQDEDKTRDLSTSTAEKWIRVFCLDGGPLEKLQHGRYRRKTAR